MVPIISDAGLRRSEAAALAWGDIQRWDDGSGPITVVRQDRLKVQGAVVAVTSAAMEPPDAIRLIRTDNGEKVFGLSESQIAQRVKVIARAAGLADWELCSGHSGRVAWPGAWPTTALPPTRSSARAAGNRAAAWSAATPAVTQLDRPCGTCKVPNEENPLKGTDSTLIRTNPGDSRLCRVGCHESAHESAVERKSSDRVHQFGDPLQQAFAAF